MKNVNFLLLAVSAFAFFLQCSAAPPDPSSETSGDTVPVDEEFIRFVYRAITASENSVVDADRDMGNGLRTATGEDKEKLERAKEWLDGYLKKLVAEFPVQLLNAIYSGSVTALEDCKFSLDKIIPYLRASRDEFQVTVPAGEAKDSLIVAIETVITLSGKVYEGLTETLAGTTNTRII